MVENIQRPGTSKDVARAIDEVSHLTAFSLQFLLFVVRVPGVHIRLP